MLRPQATLNSCATCARMSSLRHFSASTSAPPRPVPAIQLLLASGLRTRLRQLAAHCRYCSEQSGPMAGQSMFGVQGAADTSLLHPMQGVDVVLVAARAAYATRGAPEALQLFVEEGRAHECTPTMWAKAIAWLDKHLLSPA